jgi:hypothetical protein
MRDPITYRYPRTLIEAFGCDAQSAVAIHGPYHRAPGPVQFITRMCVLIIVLFLLGTIIEGV